MKKLLFAICVICFGLTILSNTITAQSPEDIDKWVKQLKLKNWREREKAASALTRLPQEEKTANVRKALTDELAREYDVLTNRGSKERIRDRGEEDGEWDYYIWLFNSLSSDELAFPLMERIGVPEVLVKYGDKGVLAVLKKLDLSTNCNDEFESVRVLTATLMSDKEGYKPARETRNSIK